MITLALIDRKRYDNVPDEFFEKNSTTNLSEALTVLGELVLPTVSSQSLEQISSSDCDLKKHLRLVASSELYILPVRLLPKINISLDQQARDCARLIEILSKIERKFGGSGLMLLGLNCINQQQTNTFLTIDALRHLLES